MTPAERDERLLAGVAEFWPEWVAADDALRAAGLWREISAIAAGRHLSRLAREGRCAIQHGYMARYRCAPGRAAALIPPSRVAAIEQDDDLEPVPTPPFPQYEDGDFA